MNLDANPQPGTQIRPPPEAGAGRPRRPDICLVTSGVEGTAELERFITEAGCRLVVTSPGRLPAGVEWEAFDLVLIERDRDGRFPEVPVKLIHRIVALCRPEEIDDAGVLRGALRAGARDLVPRVPGNPAWKDLLRSGAARSPGAALRFLDPESQVERVFPLEKDSITIGRDPQNDLIFQQPYVSRRHAHVLRSGSRYRLVDAGSRHGTTVNGARVEEHVLADGDQIRLGGDSGPLVGFEHATVPEGTLNLTDAASLFESRGVNREVHDIAVLLETFMSLNSDLLLEEILELVLDRLIEFVGADRGVILLRPWEGDSASGPGAETLRLALARDRAGNPIPEGEVEVSSRIPEKVLRTGRGVIIEDLLAGDQAKLHPRTIQMGVRSAMCVPLKVRGKLVAGEEGPTVIGVLYVDSQSRGRPFSPRALDALEVVAAEAAMAIHTARLYEDRLEKRRMEEEMKIAHQIQRNIFPEQEDRGRFWELRGTTDPSLEVGGDFFSHFPMGEERLAVVLGDVSGKGVPAALFSAMIHGLFQGLATFREGPEDLGKAMTELNRFLLVKSQLQKFVTAIIGILEADGRFYYVNAGHNPGLVIRRGGAEEELKPCGTILGMFEEEKYETATVTLEPGDALVLYSDGLTESRNPSGEAFGVDSLKRAARERISGGAAEIHAGIIRTFEESLKGKQPLDDVTLLVVKRIDEAPMRIDE